MNNIDIVLSIILLILFLWGLKKGLLASVVHLIALIATIVMITELSTLVRAILIMYVSLSTGLATILSYIVVIILVFILVRIIISISDKIMHFLKMKWLDRILGGLFGIFNGLFLFTLLIIIIDLFPVSKSMQKYTKQSKILTSVRIIKEELSLQIPKAKKQDEIDKLIEQIRDEPKI